MPKEPQLCSERNSWMPIYFIIVMPVFALVWLALYEISALPGLWRAAFAGAVTAVISRYIAILIRESWPRA